jgi:hypothetical protein
MDIKTLERDFRKAFGAFWAEPGSTPADFLAYCHEAGTFIDEDVPFPLDKAGFWDTLEWKPRELSYKLQGATGIVSCNFVLRGKPKNAGFRLRPGTCTVVCAWDANANAWRALSIHLSPLRSQILDASPS